MTQFLRPLWAYRSFILGSVQREFQSRYQNSLLGAAWAVISPLAMIIIYTVIFSRMMGARLPGMESGFGYSIYLCAGVLTWGLFTEIVTRAQSIFLENANLIKKVNFPHLCLPVAVIFTACLNFFIIFALFMLFLLMIGHFPGWIFLALFPVLALHILFSVGLGMILAVFNVFFRDVGQLSNVVLQFCFWLTPIVYPVSVLPESLQTLMLYNPMAGLAGAYQTILVHGQAPEWLTLWPAALLSGLFALTAVRLFRRHAGDMVDEL
jgi:lipopolysaccharide transport system permease protein